MKITLKKYSGFLLILLTVRFILRSIAKEKSLSYIKNMSVSRRCPLYKCLLFLIKRFVHRLRVLLSKVSTLKRFHCTYLCKDSAARYYLYLVKKTRFPTDIRFQIDLSHTPCFYYTHLVSIGLMSHKIRVKTQ